MISKSVCLVATTTMDDHRFHAVVVVGVVGPLLLPTATVVDGEDVTMGVTNIPMGN